MEKWDIGKISDIRKGRLSITRCILDPNAVLTTRIDHVFLYPLDLTIDKVKCDVVGDEVSDMVYNPNAPVLWPSDHAGVVAKVKFVTPE
jgi:hypothetical protein